MENFEFKNRKEAIEMLEKAYDYINASVNKDREEVIKRYNNKEITAEEVNALSIMNTGMVVALLLPFEEGCQKTIAEATEQDISSDVMVCGTTDTINVIIQNVAEQNRKMEFQKTLQQMQNVISHMLNKETTK